MKLTQPLGGHSPSVGDSRRYDANVVPGRRRPPRRNGRLQAEDLPQSSVDISYQDPRQSPGSVSQQRTIDQLQSKGNGDRVLRKTGRGRRQHDIPCNACSFDVRRKRDNVSLPDINRQRVVGRYDKTRPTFIQLNPVDVAARYHEAERSIRSTAARDSSTVGRSANAASIRNC